MQTDFESFFIHLIHVLFDPFHKEILCLHDFDFIQILFIIKEIQIIFHSSLLRNPLIFQRVARYHDFVVKIENQHDQNDANAYTATGQIQQISEYGNQLQQNSNDFRKRIKRLPEMLIRLVRDFLHEIVHRLTLKVRIIQ